MDSYENNANLSQGKKSSPVAIIIAVISLIFALGAAAMAIFIFLKISSIDENINKQNDKIDQLTSSETQNSVNINSNPSSSNSTPSTTSPTNPNNTSNTTTPTPVSSCGPTMDGIFYGVYDGYVGNSQFVLHSEITIKLKADGSYEEFIANSDMINIGTYTITGNKLEVTTNNSDKYSYEINSSCDKITAPYNNESVILELQ